MKEIALENDQVQELLPSSFDLLWQMYNHWKSKSVPTTQNNVVCILILWSFGLGICKPSSIMDVFTWDVGPRDAEAVCCCRALDFTDIVSYWILYCRWHFRVSMLTWKARIVGYLLHLPFESYNPVFQDAWK